MVLFHIIIGAILVLTGSVILTYFLAQGWENWPTALMGGGISVAGLILLYASFKPVIM